MISHTALPNKFQVVDMVFYSVNRNIPSIVLPSDPEYHDIVHNVSICFSLTITGLFSNKRLDKTTSRSPS
jgi:hypothetical protein